MSILQTTGLKKYYGAGPGITRALDGVDFSVEQGEFVAVVGTSGSGKSTLLHMMGGLDIPTSGSVCIRGKELAEMNDEQLTVFRRRNIGFIFRNFSGGQQQRVAIARALVTKPAIVLADEKRTGNELNQTMVMITHNQEIAQLADRIVRIEDGKIKAQGVEQ